MSNEDRRARGNYLRNAPKCAEKERAEHMRRHPADHNGYHDHTRSILKLATEFRCPLLGVKRSSIRGAPMSAFDP
jgi:hypothetical protein